MEDTTQKRTGRFNKDLAKKIEDQIADYEGPADSQGVEYKTGNEEPDEDDTPSEGMVAAALNKLKQEEDKPIPVPGIDNEVTEDDEEPSGLMARRT